MHLTKLIIILLQYSLFACARSIPRAVDGAPFTLNTKANSSVLSLLGPIVALTPVPATDTTVTFTKIAANPPGKATQADTLDCAKESLAQIKKDLQTKGAYAETGSFKFSGKSAQNADCLTLRDMDKGDGKVLLYGVVVEALQGILLQMSEGTSAAADFQVFNTRWGYMGWGSIGVGATAPDVLLPIP
ncbi:MAG: hypothetical protein Q9186_005597 [Xanthomendoza sp. 1 TL-2023]